MIIKRRNSNLVSNSFFNINNAGSEQEKTNKKRLSVISSIPSNSSKKEIHLFHKAKKDLQISRYPLLEYVVSIALFIFAAYIFGSIAGIPWGIPQFYKKEWWHFSIGGVCLAFSIAVLFNADSQIFSIIKREDIIFHKTFKFFCLFENSNVHKISEVTNIQITESGAAKKVSLHSRWYGCQISFRNCQKITVLKCISEQNAELYKQKIVSALDIDIKRKLQMIEHIQV